METPTKEEIKAARRIAENMAFMGGPDLRGLSDAEVVEKMRALGANLREAFTRAGVSAQQATTALKRLGEAASAAGKGAGFSGEATTAFKAAWRSRS